MFLVQTPHFFINPDPIEKNLQTFTQMPGENEMFYKVIQRGLHRYWREHPAEFPVRRRHLTAELRPQLDIVNRHMLLLLIYLENMPPVSRSHVDGLVDRRLRTSTALCQLEELRRDAADIALRSLYSAI